MKTNDRVLELLYDRRGGFFLLDELAAAAGVSSTRLGGILEQLANCGYSLDYSPAYGVCLQGPVKPNAHLIERGLTDLRIGRSVICFDEVASTNDVAMASARQGDTDGLVVLAESQTKGRGRQGRRWIAAPGQSILMSVLLLEDAGKPPRHEAYTIAAGLAVAEGLEDACGVHPSLKWPNDVLLDGKKAAGILVEMRTNGDQRAIVIGAGINVEASPTDSEVDCPATHLAVHTSGDVDRTSVIVAVLRKLSQRIADITVGRIEALHRPWMDRCSMMNQRIAVRSAGVLYVGRVLDVDPMSGLVLCCDNGRQHHLPAESSSIEPGAGA